MESECYLLNYLGPIWGCDRYDGASNMHGELNGLQALILKECPYAYYLHCFAHQLQLALVLTSKDVAEVHKFFKNLNIIINIISSSCKRNDQLIDAQVAEIAHLAEIGELETVKGQNQIQSVQRPRDTKWSSHFRSICSLISLYGPAYVVLSDIAVTGSTASKNVMLFIALNTYCHLILLLHLGSTLRKYMHFGLNLERNRTRLQLYSKSLKVLFLDRGDGINIPCDAVRALKGRCQDLYDDKKARYEEALRKSDQMHQDFEKSSLAMTHKLVDIIDFPKSQPKKTYKEDLEYKMEDEVGNSSPQSTPQVLPSFEKCTLPVTYPEEVEETIRILMEHMGSTWRKYMHFGLNLGRNGTRLQLYSKSLKVLFPDCGDSVNIPCDAVRALKGRRQDLL
ncbi:zinc finger MYM-type protein 1-like protein [Tanacetum coccineum]